MPHSTEEIRVARWSEFEGEIERLSTARRDQAQASRPLLFRGLGNSRWGLETTLERAYPAEKCDETLSLRAYYRKTLSAKPVLEAFSGRRWELPDPPTFERRLEEHWSWWLDIKLGENPGVYEYLAYLRHHGFPSPLLDWTVSPYVAALFAFETVPENVERVCV
jgi:hypothetical protein